MDLGLLLAARLDVDAFSGRAEATGEPGTLAPPPTPPSAAWIGEAVRAAVAHQRSGHPARVWPVFRVLEPLLPRLEEEDPASTGRILAALATQALLEADVEAFLDRARRAAAAFERAGDARAAAGEHAARGAAYRALGAWAEAERALDAATAAAPPEETAVVARVALDRARVRWGRGAAGEARALATEAAGKLAEHGDGQGEGIARGYLAGILLATGDAVGAADAARRARVLLDASAGGRAFAGAALAQVLLGEGRIAEALAAAEQAAAAITEAGRLAEGEVTVRLALADARARAGDGPGAATALDGARHAVLADAARLREPALRRAFLEEVPDHRRALGSRT